MVSFSEKVNMGYLERWLTQHDVVYYLVCDGCGISTKISNEERMFAKLSGGWSRHHSTPTQPRELCAGCTSKFLQEP